MLKINHLSKRFETHQALQNISFSVKSGAIVGLLGHNGAGKTTLIRIIVGIIESDTGTVELNTEQISSDIIKKEIGYLPEERGLYKGMKVMEYLIYIAKLRELKKENRIEQINQWLEKLSLTDWKDKEIGTLSKGMQQKVQFIASVIHNPSLLILDEPFSGFDPLNEQHIIDEIIKLKNNGTTILFSTHRMDSIEELCDDLIFLNKGKLIFDGTVTELLNQYETNEFKVISKTNTKQILEADLQTYLTKIPEGQLVEVSKNKKSLKDIFIDKINEN